MKTLIATSALVVCIMFSALVVAQTQTPTPVKDDIPEAAWLTERGAALAQRLKWLRRSEANMGAKHPSLPGVRKQIAGIQKELKAWAPAANPFAPEINTDARAVPKMNDEDLRQLVVRLSVDVANLKKRVAELERRK